MSIGNIVKFTVQIKNFGKVPAKNVEVSLQGIPASWIKEEVSETSLLEIKPGQETAAEIFVEMREAGNRQVFARVEAEGISEEVNSNMLSFEVGTASLLVSISMQG